MYKALTILFIIITIGIFIYCLFFPGIYAFISLATLTLAIVFGILNEIKKGNFSW